ncbi:hypothetical protein P3X46_011304 [Hevea brasiliensis]|uniref:Protein MAINTENANCE OF PSII UNDER HIGH LIGHT 1 n=1 Tax=Hevea brasiliensis TaxID=3981 RepID=A0ABQ9MJG5_HEVBR|nr:protein MAINTENANCE OF PSII UNDER HIGH LIGHT 1 [Hevea brasiliensis]KAJ9179525.1 hypothetical protein P3X46_011304 [Hevea brasiliensis]
MACVSQAMISANTCTFTSPRLFKKCLSLNRQNFKIFTIRASSDDPDCNDEDCAPDKEVGKVSMEWLAGEKTKVVGTFPPRSRGWTGYVEKDTAGQKNIYSVEPAIYVAESAISSGTAGSSADGAENTKAIAAGLALISVAAASLILIQVGKTPTVTQAVEYSGPALSYYINKFKPPEIVQAAVPSQGESSPSVQPENSASEVPQIQVQSQFRPAPSTSSENSIS